MRAERQIGPLIIAGLAIATIALATFGWFQVLGQGAPGNPPIVDFWRRLDQSVYLSLHGLIMGGPYASPDQYGWNASIRIARWLGAIVFGYAAIATARALFASRYAGLRAALAHDSTVIIGDHSMALSALELAAAAGKKVIHLSPEATTETLLSGVITLPFARIDISAAQQSMLARASRIIVATKDDAQTAEIVTEMTGREDSGIGAKIGHKTHDIVMGPSKPKP